MLKAFGTPVILFGMVCSVEEKRDLVVTVLDFPGLTRTYQLPLLPLSLHVSVWMKTQTMRILESIVLSST